MKILILIIITVIIIAGGYFLIKFNSSPVQNTMNNESNSPAGEPSPTPTPTPPLADMVKATIVTARGSIEFELYPKVAPKTVGNFVKLAQDKFYDGIKFHRVVPDFVIQAGDPLSRTDDPRVGSGGPGYSFADEINPKALGLPDTYIKQLESRGYIFDFNLPSIPIKVGTMAMANAGPNTNGSQFYIVTTTDQPSLNGMYTAFGNVIKGMDVVRAITQGDVITTIKISQ